MEGVKDKISQILRKLEGPEALQTWRDTPQSNTQYRLLILLSLIILIIQSVFQSLFIGIAKLRKDDDEEHSEHYTLVYTYTMISILVGTIIGGLITGVIADRVGRRKTLIVSLIFAIPYVFVYVISLWIVFALDFDVFSAFFILIPGFLLGLCNNQLPVIMACGFDITSHLSHVFTTVVIALLGAGFGPAVVKEIFGYGFIICINHVWFFPLYGIITSMVLGCALILIYQFLPETLGKEIPPHPLQSLYSTVMASSTESDGLSSIPGDISHRVPISDELDHGWIYPLHVLRDIRAWLLFWLTFGYYGSMVSLTILSVMAMKEYGAALDPPSDTFFIVFIVERLIVALISIGIIILVSILFPHRILQIGYLRLVKASILTVFAIAIFFTCFIFILSIMTEEWLYTIAVVIYPLLLDIVFIASILFLLSIYCIMSNIGFRNESAFLFAFLTTSLIGGIITLVPLFISMTQWFEIMHLARFSLIFIFIVFILAFASGLLFYRIDDELNSPRAEQRKHSDKAIDRPIYLGSPVLFIILIVSALLFLFIYMLFL